MNNNAMSKNPHIARFTITEYSSIRKKFNNQINLLENIIDKTPKKIIVKISDLEKIKDKITGELYNLIYLRAHGIDYRHFSSIFLQLKTVIQCPKTEVDKILEIGKGVGNFAQLIENYGYLYSSLDVNADFNPTKVGSVLEIPWEDESFDMVCAFEVLEHLPSDNTELALLEMKRVSGKYIFISLPCQRNSFRLNLELSFRQWALSKLGFKIDLFSTLPTYSYKDQDENSLKKRVDKANPHYWEVGRKSFPKKRIIQLLNNIDLKVIKQFHNPEFSYHWYILCQKK